MERSQQSLDRAVAQTLARVTRVPRDVKPRYGNDGKEKPVRVPFGLGAQPSDANAVAMAEKCLTCGFGNVPVTEEVIWTIPLPMTQAQVRATFGDIVNLFSPSGAVAGIASIDSTFLVNGILQTDLYTTGIGVHLFVEPITFEALGNGWTAPVGSDTAPPPSPDVFTVNDVANGALGLPGGTTMTQALLDWGTAGWEAAWNFANAYQLQLRTNQRELMLNEQLADVSYMASFGDVIGAGTSQVNQAEFAAIVNAQYRVQGSAMIYLPANFRRYGSVTVAGVNVGLFHPTRDYAVVDATRGGPKVQGSSCGGGMYRKFENPCFFERGIPIGPQFVVNDPVHQARFQAALAIDDFTGSQNLEVDVNLGGNTIGGGNVMLEQTLDSMPVNVVQQLGTAFQVYKGGIFKVAVKLKGWEMPGKWKSWCKTNAPQVLASNPTALAAA